MRVLHVASWYPNESNPHEAMWIKRHVYALEEFVSEQFVLHLEVRPSRKFRLKRTRIDLGISTRLELPFTSWFLVELLTAFLLAFYLWRLRHKRFDLINFHIAYPTLVFWNCMKKWVKAKVVITEHWSAYHFNFGISTSKKLVRIKHIFCRQIPVIAVSSALAQDLKSFSGCDFPTSIVSNIVDDSVFYADNSTPRDDTFFMVSQWKWPKQPLIALEAFRKFVAVHPGFKLKVAGYGPDYRKLEAWISDNRMTNEIVLLGALTPPEIASQFRACRGFIHSSEYETFSVVCAEAISCGTPVLASGVGGIPEVVRKEEGVLLDTFDIDAWSKGMHLLLTSDFSFENAGRFTRKEVGRRYYDVLENVISR